jgi:hypothetical protein
MSNEDQNLIVKLIGQLQIAFVVLKLCKVIIWAWLWVLSPIWIFLAILIIIAIIITIADNY